MISPIPTYNIKNINIPTLKKEFPRLQISCPIVDANKVEITSPAYVRLASSSTYAPSPILGEGRGEVLLPEGNRNYVVVDQAKVDCFVRQREQALPYVAEVLGHSNDEAQITEMLYIFNNMIDTGVKDTKKMYPVLARFNNTTSPNIQTFLAGIYRKLQVPDAFGPLVKMLIQNSLKPQTTNFDPNEEIGGAILSYIDKWDK